MITALASEVVGPAIADVTGAHEARGAAGGLREKGIGGDGVFGNISHFLDCEGSPRFRALRLLAAELGWRHPRVFHLALQIWESIDLRDEQRGHGGAYAEPNEHFAYADNDFVAGPGVREWLGRQVLLFGFVLGTATWSGGWLGPIRETDCPYGFVATQYAILLAMMRGVPGGEELVPDLVSTLLATTVTLLQSPFHTWDLMESSAWNFSSYDLAVNLAAAPRVLALEMGKGAPFDSFASYASQRPVPKPVLLPWHAESVLPRGVAEPVAMRFLRHRAAFAESVSVAIVQVHDASAAELWETLRAAVRLSTGVQDAAALPELRPRFYFTRPAALKGTPTGAWLGNHTEVPFERFAALKRIAQAGHMTVLDVHRRWLPHEMPSLVTQGSTDIVICGDPGWLCPLLAIWRPGPMITTFCMGLLNEFHWREDSAALAEYWHIFYAALAPPPKALSSRVATHDPPESVGDRALSLSCVACRFTAEQVYYQTGLRFPYVPFLGLRVTARYNPTSAPKRRALLFRNNRQHIISYHAAVKLLLEARGLHFPVDIADLTTQPQALPFQDMVSFDAVIFLPHGPHALRLCDVYAAAIPALLPDEPLVHRFIWASRTFGLLDAEPQYRARAPSALRQAAAAQQGQDAAGPSTGSALVPPDHPPFSPFTFAEAWSLHRHIDDRRYWYQYTEWATLPHLLRFRSIPHLLEILASLDADKARGISAKMGSHQASMVADALGWWRSALAAVIDG